MTNNINQYKKAKRKTSYIPLSHVNANCIVFPPTPQKASTITSHRQRLAICRAIFSGVTLNHPSK